MRWFFVHSIMSIKVALNFFLVLDENRHILYMRQDTLARLYSLSVFSVFGDAFKKYSKISVISVCVQRLLAHSPHVSKYFCPTLRLR
jgi:hypothetical protein